MSYYIASPSTEMLQVLLFVGRLVTTTSTDILPCRGLGLARPFPSKMPSVIVLPKASHFAATASVLRSHVVNWSVMSGLEVTYRRIPDIRTCWATVTMCLDLVIVKLCDAVEDFPFAWF